MLTKQQIKRLKEEAHFLKPIMNIGKEGLTESVITSIYDCFNTRELIKIKFLDNSPESKETLKSKISVLKDIEIVQIIGHTFILFKENKK